MKPTEVLDMLVSMYKFNTSGKVPRQRQINLFLEGAPGVSKSSLVYQAAAMIDGQVGEFRCAGADASEVKGIPDLIDGRTKWATPEEFPTDPDWRGFLFFDEIVQGTSLVQSSLSQLVLEGRMGAYVLPKGAVIVAAGNRRSDRSAVNEMPRHMADRFTFVPVEADVDDFCGWAGANDVRPEVTSFIRDRRELLAAFDPTQPKSPSPRGWAFVSSLLDSGLKDIALQTALAGQVGSGAAIEFLAHLRLFGQIPTVEEILADPDNARVPEGENAPSMCYAVASNLSRIMAASNAKKIVAYISRFPSEEFAVVTMKDALEREKIMAREGRAPAKGIATVPEVRAWATKNAKLVF
jgi:hypothetical protein